MVEISEDVIPGNNGVSRRPGNVWTAEAREDVFNRREAGEGWETICPDYPNRSRHAMQQQYSMMKKQRAVADGTWISNRRGRKRKLMAGERWTSVSQQRPGWDEPEEEEDSQDDDFEEAGTEEVLYTREKDSTSFPSREGDTLGGFRPSLLARSATDPVTRTARSKIIKFPHHTRSGGLPYPTIVAQHDALDSSKASTDNEWSAPTVDQPPYSRKRQRLSTDMTGKPITDPVPIVPAHSRFPAIMLEEAEIQELLEHARNRGRNFFLFHETEKSSQREAFESAISRATRRANDMEEQLRNMAYEHADDLKFKQQQHVKETLALRRDFEKEQKIRTNSYNQKTDALNRTIEGLRQDREDKDKSSAQEVASIRRELQSALSIPTPTNNACATDTSPAELKHQLDNKEEELKLLVQFRRNMTQKLSSLRCLQNTIKDLVSQTKAGHEKMAATLDRLKDGLEDLSMKAISRALGELAQGQSETEQSFAQVAGSMEVLDEALNATAGELLVGSVRIIDAGNVEDAPFQIPPNLTNGIHNLDTPAAVNGSGSGHVVSHVSNGVIDQNAPLMEARQASAHPESEGTI
ncbi:hypothetical protein MMC13_000089 [Lambiella insularis]|nr:hypothetical protein [Lambiella insularis]